MGSLNNKNINKLILIPTFLYLISIFIGLSLYGYNINILKDNITSLTFLDIFLNNLRGIGINILGIFSFGVITIFYTIFNGLIHGIMIRVFFENFSLLNTLLKIVPHGIFEVPAIILSCHIGLFPIYIILNKFFNIFCFKKSILLNTLKNLIFLDILLVFIAAIIESTITKLV